GLGRLHAERGSVYASVATMTVLTDGRGAQAIAGEVLDRLIGSEGLLVAAPGSSYRVLVRPGLLAEATAELPLAGVATVLLVSRDDEPALAPLRSGLAAAGVVVQAAVVPGGPPTDLAIDLEMDLEPPRADLVVAVGDAAVMDGARGFATHRDVPLALVPRSLQAQVECVLGGGYDPSSGETPGYRPVVVLGDPVGITPASDPRFGAGLAAAVRIALVADPDALELLVASAAAVLAGEVDALTGLVRRSVTTSARVLTQDASVGRVHLSYGDEFAHAFERLLGAQDMAALPWGLMAAAHLARRLGMIDATVVDRHREVLCAFGLATAARFSWEAVQHAWSRPEMLRPEMYRPDRFVLLHAPGRAEAGVLADDGALRGALDDLAEDR
ncbi:MAG: 3-dehydroquinate synthase family protein, partial [Janthinobacterium lividum]